MSSVARVAVSQIIHDTSNEEEPKKKSREDWRKAKELEEARKAGTAPAAVDEEGRDINPHIPQYISAAPWYYGTSGPTLKHQRPQHEDLEAENSSKITVIPTKGVDTRNIITKFRKGACDNCGAITHKKKDCLERPRKIGAKFAEVVVTHDEHIPETDLTDFDSKRDRWNNYDPSCHKDIIDEFEKVEEAKRQLKADKLQDNPEAEISDEESADEDKYADDFDMPGTKVDSKQRITVRNLRIREDTAKYLRNLDPNSAYYDPKTRSMRDNPNPKNKPEESEFGGENFVRFTGDTHKHTQAQLFAWEAYEKGVDIHLLAEPTKLELLQHEYDKKKGQFKSETKDHILDRYGGEEHLKVPPKTLLLAQTEDYVEYSRSGKVIKGQEKQKVKSIYEEDILLNNHKFVWGSYWNHGKWGYKCCHSFVKNSYCVGDKLKYSHESSDELPGIDLDHVKGKQNPAENEEQAAEDDKSNDKKKLKKKSKKVKKSKDKKKKREKEKEKQKVVGKSLKELDADVGRSSFFESDDRKRAYNSRYEGQQPTEEEMEMYMMKRKREEDPMTYFMNN